MKKKVVIASNTSWSLFNFRHNLACSLKRHGYEVVLVAPEDDYSHKLAETFEYYDIWMNNKGTNPLEDFKTAFKFYQLYKKIRPDVVLHFTIKPNIYGTIAAGVLGVKSINNIAGLGTLFINQNLSTKIAKLLYRYSQKKATKVFFQNNDDYSLFKDENLVDEEKCDLLPGSGVDTEKFLPVKKDSQKNTFIFLLIARVLWDKGIKEYIEAIKLLRKKYGHVEFQLLGSLDADNRTAVSKQYVNGWVKDGLINYLGETDNVKGFICKADCIVLPSYREGTPRVLLESASMAKPLVTTNVPGCREAVDDGFNGFLCEVKNAEDLTEKMEKVMSLTEEDRIKMGNNGRKKMISEFDEKIVINQYLNTLREVL